MDARTDRPGWQSPALGSGVTASLLGLVLVAAAGLKLYGLNASVVPQSGWLFDLRLQMAAVIWELALGTWLVLGRGSVAAWLTGLVTFLAFAGVSGYLGWVGVAHCGCFGALPASPWHAFAVDVAAVGLLVLFRPADVFGRVARVVMSPQTWAAVGGVAAAAGAFHLFTPGLASLDRLLPAVRDDALVVEPSLLDGGTVAAGASGRFTVRVTNRSDRAVKILGAPSTCRCMAVADLPATLRPGESTGLGVYVRYGWTPGTFDHRFQFYAEDGGMLRVTCRITARVLPPPDSSE